MSFVDSLFEGLKSQVMLRADVDRTIVRLDSIGDRLLDHERRLVRLETLVEIARGDFNPRNLPER